MPSKLQNKPSFTVKDCTFIGAQTDKLGCEAIIALSKAAEANAIAIQKIASHQPSFTGSMLTIGEQNG